MTWGVVLEGVWSGVLSVWGGVVCVGGGVVCVGVYAQTTYLARLLTGV